MKRLNVNFPLLFVQLLPPHKRQSARVKILQTLYPLQSLYNGFKAWRDGQSILLNLNSQVKRLQGYLCAKFHPRISIQTRSENLTGISLLEEGQILPVGIYPDEAAAPFPLLGELSADFGDADFLVSVPAGVDAEALKIEIEKFKQIDKHYKIKTV